MALSSARREKMFFVHFSAIQENDYRSLNEGETVEFDLMQGPKGFQAANVVRV